MMSASLVSDFKSESNAPAQVGDRETVAIAATFTAEPLEKSLSFWLDFLGIPAQIRFAPYNQVFQQLMDPQSLLGQNSAGLNLILWRPEDWLAGMEEKNLAEKEKSLRQNAQDLVTALSATASRSTTPYWLCLCPASSKVLTDPEQAELIRQIEVKVLESLGSNKRVRVLTAAEVLAVYPVQHSNDTYSDEIAHIPYTREFFCALGTLIIRKWFGLRSKPYKVIVLDCDQTLWQGVCAEDGPHGIQLDASRRWLHEFLLKRQANGMLLGLCSKNNEQDVLQVFEQRPDLPLRPEHLTAWRINWRSKSENLQSLAQELGLGLDSFVFLDDNPVECAEVQAQCPEVLTLRLPEAIDRLPQFLQHVWAFDTTATTEADRQRTGWYQENVERERLRRETPSLAEFLNTLDLVVEISPLTPAELPRVAQLTQRTNQFNLTSQRRTEAELQGLWETGAIECEVVRVRDRFGDYGLVGVLLFQQSAEVLEVDNLLLSCRALGRGVEHQMLARLGNIAQTRGLSAVEVPYLSTDRNLPALNFLKQTGATAQAANAGSSVFRFTAEFAAALVFNPSAGDEAGSKAAALTLEPAVSEREVKPEGLKTENALINSGVRAARLSEIATALQDTTEILERLRRPRRTRPNLDSPFQSPRTPVETELADIWREVLGIEPIGVQDDFFELGGHSLLLTRVASWIRSRHQVELTLAQLFDARTIERMTIAIATRQAEQQEAAELAQLLAEIQQLSPEEIKTLL
jgi:FkbH-like protein